VAAPVESGLPPYQPTAAASASRPAASARATQVPSTPTRLPDGQRHQAPVLVELFPFADGSLILLRAPDSLSRAAACRIPQAGHRQLIDIATPMVI
jgi:hypothetical protein